MVKVTRSVIFGKRRSVEAQLASLRRADGKEGQIIIHDWVTSVQELQALLELPVSLRGILGLD